ncbi:MAG: DNA-directed RNA polymerase [Candidatus Aenigmarchaeota archaeon]|nr:DNA-directed RNA polymerase [Candidatus Aenigmarchaeota archaeon]
MYKMLELKDEIKVPPAKFGLGLQEAVRQSLMDRWDGVIDKRLGVVLVVTKVIETGEGRIYAGDGSIHYPVTFEVMVYKPNQHEIVEGEIIDVTEFGVFIRLGPVDGMIHVSQLMDDFVTFDRKNVTFMGKETKQRMKEGDVVRARIISVSVSGGEYKIGLTARQPNLGSIDWLKESKAAAKKKAAKPS